MKYLATIGHECDERRAVRTFATLDGRLFDPASDEDLDADDLELAIKQVQGYLNNLTGARSHFVNQEQTDLPTLLLQLNSNNFTPDTPHDSYGLVDLYHNDEPATLKELQDLHFLRGYVDAHPEGSDRGGNVPYVEFTDKNKYGRNLKAYYDELDAHWFGVG